MFNIFNTTKRGENSPKIVVSSSDNCIQQNTNNSNVCQSNSNDYHVLIGDNQFNPCTSQQSFCQSQQSSFEQSSNQYNKIYRNYISSPHLFFLVLFLIIYVLLMLLGASVFSLFEQKAEFQTRDQLLRMQQNFLAKHPCIDAESLDQFVESVITGLNSGVDLHQLNQMLKHKHQNIPQSDQTVSTPTPDKSTTRMNPRNDKKYKKNSNYDNILKRNAKQEKPEKSSIESNEDSEVVVAFSIPTEYSNWEFTSSLMFVTSVVTTIGYGHVTPNTPEGKVFCIIFSCIAIPFTLLFLSIIVSLLKNGPVKVFEKWLIRIISRHFRNTPDFFIRLLHVLFVTLILLLLILILPALIFFNVEKNWTFLDSVYYCYISLTTVGLGDFVPATADITQYQSIQLYRICIIIYLYGGLSLIMLWIAVILRIPQLNLKPFLLTEKEEKEEKEELDENSKIIDYYKDVKHISYGTEFSANK